MESAQGLRMKNLSLRDRRAFLKEARRLSSFHMSKLQSDRGGDILRVGTVCARGMRISDQISFGIWGEQVDR